MKRLLAPLLLIPLAIALSAPEPRKAFSYAYDQHDLPNGLRVVTVPTTFPNVVALYIVVQVGSRNEVEPGKSGFAHLFEHVMFRGTRRFPPEKYEAVMKSAGAATNAYTSDDITVYHATFSKEDLETILDMEADRFQNLEYTPAVFKTETLAVLGEYNKNSSSPEQKLDEILRDTAFERHTYKHTTMGFLKDVQNMPNQYEYSRQFFDRYYRPEYATICIVGDVQADSARRLVEKYWAGWKRGSYKADIPVEPPPEGPHDAQVKWPAPTLPWMLVGYRGSRYSDSDKDQATLDIVNFIGFSPSSPLYKKLVIDEQKVDLLGAENPDRVDPFMFLALARVKDPRDIAYTRDQVLETVRTFTTRQVAQDRLEAVKSNLRYRFALGLNSSEAIASALARYVGLRRTPETINRLYDIYARVTPADVLQISQKYFTDKGRTTVTLTGGGASK